MKNEDRHDSQRGWFAYELYQHMKKNKDIILIVGDLGYKVFDKHREDMPHQFINTGAAEVAMMDLAVGLALSDKIPVVYSITTFLLYRPFEVIRNYINHENIPVKLAGSGRDRDYAHDGISHWADDAESVLKLFPNIHTHFPKEKEEIPNFMETFLYSKHPSFISLTR